MKLYLQSNGYVFNQDVGLWHRPEYEGINYTDGLEIENRLKTIVSGVDDVSVMSVELAKSCTDWPSLYHLSRKRANLLRPFEERLQGKNVLEVGAGCGALTRYLGELGAKVVALEGSIRRASIVASRCRGLSNVTIVGEAIHHFNPGPQFDFVTLIGVLEYARKFFPSNGADPVDAMLGYVKRLLKPGGTLIIAIENQLGLKYFAGFPEDHVGKSMFGIEEHYGQGGVVTFGRRELARRVRKIGLTEQEWWYPFPDYKLPSLMVSDIGILPTEGIDLTPVLRSACIDDPQYPPYVHFHQERALRPIMRNGLLGEVANSFVLLATDMSCRKKPDIPLAVHFATERRPEFAKKVVFTQTDHCAGYTSQVALYPIPKPNENLLIIQRLVNQAFVKGELWQDRLIQIMTSPGWTLTQIEKWLQVWLDAFCDVVGINKSCDITKKKIPGQYLDLIPRNMIMDENGVPIFIDQEWVLGKELEVGYVVYRALFSSFYALGGIAQTGEKTLPSILCLVRKIGQSLGISFSDHEIKRYHDLECDFQQLVVGNSRLSYEVMAARRFRISRALPASYNQDAEAHGQIVLLKEALLERENQIAVLTKSVKDLDEQFIRLKLVLSEKELAKKPLVSIIGSDGGNCSPGSGTQQLPHIVAIVNDPICSQIRIIQALTAGVKKSWLRGTIKIEGAEGSHPHQLPSGSETVWIVQRTCRINISGIGTARSTGTRLVHDIDDLLWKIPEDNQNYQVVKKWLIDHMIRLLELADCVTTSTIPLQIALERLGIKATVLPNCLVAEEWKNLDPQKRVGTKPRVGWAGQVGVHRSDLHFLTSVFEDLGGEVEWVFLGEVPEGLRRSGIKYAVHPMVPLCEFPRKLASLNLDLALAPLALNEFNEAKSDLRLLQYGILGYPVIGTDIYPHQHSPIQRVPHDPKYWIQAIRERIHDLDALEREGEQLRQWVMANRLIEHVLPKYEQAWLGRTHGKDGSALHSKEQISSTPVYSPKIHGGYAFDCSIVIPVFNKAELTRQCLIHLAEVTDGCSYEVILVDNNSSDGTKEFLSTLGGDIQVITNPENYGFSKACNQGASAAKGRYLVFLNNDTIPKAGWLRALWGEVEQHQDVAIVGSKLLYPDDTLQHAGVVFSKNCLTPYHVFRGASGNLQAANIRREFQVVTAACMLIRHEEFDAVGGFDEIFKNGFEDVDLCLKVGRRGKKIIYQPQSVLYHLEHQTPGRKDPASERHNGQVLMERWGSSIIVDEDLYTVPEGYANRYYFRDGWLRQLLEPFRDEHERAQWEKVKTVQQLLLWKQKKSNRLPENDESLLMSLLTDASGWPQDIEVLRWGAGVCRSMNVTELELKFWECILSLGEDGDAREALAKSLLAQKNISEASCHIRNILSQNGEHPMGNFLNGILHMQKQQYAEAVQSFQKALASGADRNKTQRGLGMAYEGLGRPEQAWKVFNNVREECPDDSEIMNHLLQTGTALAHWEELGNILTTYLERNPADCDMRFALSGVQLRAGRISQAQYHYSILATLKPDYEGIQDLQSMLDQPDCLPYAVAK